MYKAWAIGEENLGHILMEPSLALNESELALKVGDSATLTLFFSPVTPTSYHIGWVTSDESVVTVKASGEVTAVGEGTATVSAVRNDNVYDLNSDNGCTITVKAADDDTPTDDESTVDAIFTDVEAGKWYTEAVQYMYDNDYTAMSRRKSGTRKRYCGLISRESPAAMEAESLG